MSMSNILADALGNKPVSFVLFFFFNDTATTKIYTSLHTLSLHDALPICRTQAEQGVRSPRQCHGPLGRVAQREARDAEEGCLLLHAAGIRHDARGVRLEREKVDVADGTREQHSGRLALQAFARPRVDGEHDRALAR